MMGLTLRYTINLRLTIILVFGFTSAAFSQLTGIKNIPGDYVTITAAVTALNAAGVGAGGVTFNIPANYTETISATISLTATGTAGNPVLFQKDPTTSGANPLITAYTGGTGTPALAIQDGIWRLVGSDYITIDGIDLTDNAANVSNPSTMEYGYALYKQSTSNGCQFVTIKNCVISLNNINNALGTLPMVDGSAGIIVMNALPSTATTAVTPIAGGTNSNNKFYANTIQNCNTGIALIGYAAASPFTLADVNNDIGGSSSATGNIIINYGGAASAANPANAVRTSAQQGLNVSYNTINNNNGSGTNHPSILRGILIGAATSANATIAYNTISVNGGGTTQVIEGIENASGSTAANNTINISNNTITNCTYTTATTGGFYGILNSATPAILNITTNTISNCSSSATATGFFYGIHNTGAAPLVSISSNIFSGNVTAALTTGLFVGISNAAPAPNVTINNNTLIGNSTTALSGVYYAIYNTGAVTTTLTINSNNIGNGTTGAFTFNAANSGAQIFINSTLVAATAVLSISNNNFQGITYTVQGTGSNTYISNTAATKSQAINGNTFTSLNLNTTGSITFIANSVAVSATGTQNVNNNSIVNSFNKAGIGGTVTLFTSAATSVSGSIINNNSNNFSNITVAGATVIAGWTNTDAGSFIKKIQNNTFSNWTAGTSSVTAMSVNLTGTNNATSGNTISNISGGGSITGIATAAGNDSIYSNTINTLVSSGASAVTGIAITAGTSKFIFSNKIYDLSSSNASGTVNGILVSGTTGAVITGNIYNNVIGDLRAPAGNAIDPVRGISVTSTRVNSAVNVYYNTIYLNAASTGALFGTTGIYHTASATATTAVLNLRNNIITNISIPNGAGITVAFRRSSVNLPNYASTSNNNIFYAGAPAANRLIFYDGTNLDQTIASYKARVATRDAQSFTEDFITGSKFLSTTGSSSNYLHLDLAKATLAESGGAGIAGFTIDFDVQVRQGNTGYAGTGTAPDIGADEFEGTPATSLSGSYNVGTGQTYTSLTSAGGLFAAINSLGLSGNVTVNITSDLTEDGSNALFQWVESGVGNYTLTIQPDASTSRIISGNVLAGLIRLNGAKRVTIDGSNGTSSNYLTFRNTNALTTTGTAVTFINGASNNTVKYCNVEAAANVINGVILFSTSNATSGNTNNTISNCSINATVNSITGNVCVYSVGTVGKENSTNTISNNNIFNYRDRGLDITATGSLSWIVTNNSFYNGDVTSAINYAAASTLHGIRILGGTGYSILDNYVGGNASLASGTNAQYTSTLGIISYQGILLTTSGASPISNIKGNTIARISVSAVPTSTTAANVFIGIETNGSGINIGGFLSGDGNIVGSNTSNSSVIVTTTTTTSTFISIIRGINCNSTGGFVIGNQVGGIDIKNIGAAPASSAFSGINISNATAPSQVNNNIIGSTGTGAASNSIRVLSTSTATTTSIKGIAIAATVTSAVQVDGNIIKNLSHLSTATNVTAGGLIGIANASIGASAVTITNNTITLLSIATYTTAQFYGIYNSGACSSISINTNAINGNTTSSATGVYYAIYNSGAVTSSININSNSIGNSTTGAFTFSAANSGTQVFINNTGGTGTAALSISNNNFQGVTYSAGGSSANTYILNSAATLSQAINGNTFTNLNINTTGNIIFISNSVAVSGTGTQNVNSNSIAGTFTKTGAGTVTLFTSAATSLSGSIINNNSNNFSNITVTGAAVIAGWVNTDAGASTKTIQNNTFSNWTGGTGAITAISVSLTGAANSTTGNLLNNISSAGAITGITTGVGNDNIYSNIINTFSTTGASVVNGIAITGGTAKNIYKNKIYDLQANSTTGTVNGILVSGTTISTVNIFNNIIGDLKTPIENSATDAIRGISITATVATSTINVYYNTVYLNATSSGAAFSTSGIYHVSNATATIATLNLRNNSITNTSIPKGSGITAAYRRSSATLANYASTSNNNLFFAGTPSPTKLLFYDGTNSDQTIPALQGVVSPRELQSVTENLTAKFLSTAGSSNLFLHLDAAQPTLVESGAVNITGFTDDFDAQIRAGNTGYIGSGTLPDIGADEVFGIEVVAPAISYTALTNTTSTTNRSVAGIIITDASGINNNAGANPRIYFKRFSDANVWLDNTSSTNGWKYTEATNTTSPYNFTINYSLLYGGAAVTAGVIQYFIVAQDLSTVANVGINSGTFNTSSAGVALTSAAFPIGGTINSYNIPFSGTYNVGTGEVFTTLTKATGLFASINSVGLMGNATFNITSDIIEDGVNALNQWTESGVGNYKLIIQPDGATLRTISGNAVGGLIRLNGADRVKIDGTNGGSGSYLTFRNTNTAGTTGTAFTFINGATNDTIRYCNIEAYANATNGVILFSTSAVAGGNSNNLVDNCEINATVASNTGNTAIYSAGTAGNENSGNTISNNSIFNYRDRALDISASGSTGWIISNNNFYNGNISGAINYAAASTVHCIRILGGTGYSLLNNYVGGNAIQASGTKAVYSSTLGNLFYRGIVLTTSGASPASFIKGNTIANIAVSSVPTAANSNVFIGIEVNGSGINIGGTSAGQGNTIGSNTTNGSVSVTTTTTSTTFTSDITGIYCGSTGGSVIGNQVASIDINNIGVAPASSSFTGIYINSATAPSQVNDNIVGSAGSGAAPNSIAVLSTSTATGTGLTGIYIGATVASAIDIHDNIVQNIANLSTTSSGTFTGINNLSVSPAAVITISNNTIKNILTAANANVGSTVYSGIYSGSPSTISDNVIDNITLASTGTAAQIMGIHVAGAFAYIISGNSLANFSTASTKTADIETGAPAGYNITGILNSASVSGQVITGNTLSYFNETTAAVTNTSVSGIAIGTAGASGNIYNNRICAITNAATGTVTLPGISGIMAANGTFNVYNNVIKLDNSGSTNGIKIYGINHATNTDWNYYYNSVSIGGNGTATAARSSAFIRTNSGALILRNNVFINTRAGIGSNYAISNHVSPPTLNWASSASDYNDLYSASTNTIGEWGIAADKTFMQWQTSSAGETHSVSHSVSFIGSVYNLQPDPNSNCGLDNSGTPITTPVVINTDISNGSRSSNNPDLGAYEFSYTTFTIIVGSNSPLCSGDSVTLSVNSGNAINPAFSWSNPSHVTISTIQSPTATAMAGQYKVIVTDLNGCYVTDSTLVSINQRPTATIASQMSVCDSGFINLNISVTGTGLISGILSNGDNFSGTAPLIIVPVFVTTTTSYNINTLSDATCTAIPIGIPDTTIITATHKGDWLGITNSWNDADNWCEGVVPISTSNVTIHNGLSHYPIINSGTNAVNNITVESGASLIVSSALFQIGGNILNNGTFSVSDGTIELNGSSPQVIPSGAFSSNLIKNLIINNAAGVTLENTLNLSGVLTATIGELNTDGYLTFLSTDIQTALISGIGAGEVLGNVTMQRYLAEGYGYKYVSSPFQEATVNEFSDEVDLADSFPTFYRYDENRISSGWIEYTNVSGVLTPMHGYAANFGSSSSPKTIAISGVVNNDTVSFAPLYNHDQYYTKGFNLVGNPYPSPIDWDATSGWTRNNIDNAIYYFSAGDTDQYTGSYSSYVNGVSSDSIAGNLIPSMQGFFVHVTDGSYPVMGELTVNNGARSNDPSPVFRRPRSLPLLRVYAGFSDVSAIPDPTVFYFDDEASAEFNKTLDALKLMNTNPSTPNLYALTPGSVKLSIRAIAYPVDKLTILPLGIKTERNGYITFNARDIELVPDNLYIYLHDQENGVYHDLRQNDDSRIYLEAGKYENRFSVVFSLQQLNSYSSSNEVFDVYISGGKLLINTNIPTDEESSVIISNMLGLQISRQPFMGNGSYDIHSYLSSGMYLVSLFANKQMHSKKIIIANQ